MAVAAGHKIVCFGTFEVDLDAGEIRKAGLRVRLPGQPFRLLSALLARPGEIVTREELQHEIWGANTNVDFERGLASAVNRLREALGDSAEHPRYIETLARRGYRFIAPLSLPSGAESAPAPGTGIQPPAPPAAALLAGIPVTLNAAPVIAYNLEALSLPGGSTDLQHPDTLSATQITAPGITPSARRLRAALLLSVAALTLVVFTACLTLALNRPRVAPGPPRVEQLTHTNDIYRGPPNSETLLTIASDGPRLYAPVLVGGRPQLSSLAADGAETQPMNLPAELSSGAIADISRSGSKLLVRSLQNRESEQPLWVVPTTGSGVQRAGEVLAHDATWMPGDENSVLFATGDELNVVQLGTGEVSHYASLPGRAFWLRWSPNGDSLRFTLLDPVKHTFSLWEISAATGQMKPLRFPGLSRLDLCCGSWVTGSGAYIFQSSDERATNLWVLEPGSASSVTQLTNGPVRLTSPQPSRDGHSVFAFGTTETANTQMYDPVLREFLSAPRFLRDGSRISYSRDGSWVAWTDAEGQLWRARTDGSDLLRLSGNDLEVFRASWSPDGRQLLLMARQPGETWQIYSMSAMGGAVHRVLSDQRNLADPEWSLDGRWIAFGREADLMGEENGPDDIQLFDLKSRQGRTLPGSRDLFSPRWSPNGQWIVALSRDQARLLLYDVARGSWRTLYDKSAADPVWSGDSKSIYFHAFAQPNAAILRVDVSGRVEKVADLSNPGLPSANSYFFSGVTPEGRLLVKPRVGTGDLYRVALH